MPPRKTPTAHQPDPDLATAAADEPPPEPARRPAPNAPAPEAATQTPPPGSKPRAPRPAPARDPLDAAGDCALELAADRPWGEISLRDIARASGVGFAELYARAPSKDALLEHLSRRHDSAALDAAEADEGAEVHDRLFEAVMARVEAMNPNRDALIAIGRARGVLPFVQLLPRTARALLEAAGIDTTGPRGALRIAGMTRVWARVLQVWRDDQGALNRTMAEIDKQLRTLNTRLERLGAGF